MLTLKEIQEKLKEVNDWSLEADCLEKEFIFIEHEKTRDFINKVMQISENLEHYPLIFIDRKLVKLTLTTKGQGITEQDFLLAKEINKII